MRASSARSLELTSTPPPRCANSRISAWICALARDVDALRRLVEQQHADLARQPFRQDHLLLVAAGQRARPAAPAGAGGCRAAPSARRRARRRRRGRCQPPRVQRGRGSAAGYCRAPTGSSPGRAARSPGTMPMPAAMASAGMREPRGSPLTRTSRRPADAEQPPQHAVGAAAEQAGEPDRPRRRARACVGALVGLLQQHLAGRGRRGDDAHRAARPVMACDQVGDGERAAPARPPRRGRRAARCSGRPAPPPRRAGARCR